MKLFSFSGLAITGEYSNTCPLSTALTDISSCYEEDETKWCRWIWPGGDKTLSMYLCQVNQNTNVANDKAEKSPCKPSIIVSQLTAPQLRDGEHTNNSTLIWVWMLRFGVTGWWGKSYGAYYVHLPWPGLRVSVRIFIVVLFITKPLLRYDLIQETRFSWTHHV